MRYIDINKIELPVGWEAKAKALNVKLKAARTDAERAVIFKKNPIWQELFIPLQKLSKGKCWYSEAKDVMSDRDIDHFRPKNEAKNLDDSIREGYWWLAYDYENYRFSSMYSNQKRYDKFDKTKDVGGKSSYFPLFPGSQVATTKRRLDDEDIMLLDPIDEDDPCLLTFDELGEAIPNTLSPRDIERVKVSIRLYHLDHTPLQEERQKVWDKCQRFISEIQAINSLPDASISDKARVKFLKQEIKNMTNSEVELSAVAIACVEHNKLSRMLRA
jgi:uncharacterized protein (TIGR02646 family)